MRLIRATIFGTLAAILFALAAADAFAAKTPAQPQNGPLCKPLRAWHVLLTTRYDEAPFALWYYRGVPVQMYASRTRRSISILVYISDTEACLVLAGVRFTPTLGR